MQSKPEYRDGTPEPSKPILHFLAENWRFMPDYQKDVLREKYEIRLTMQRRIDE